MCAPQLLYGLSHPPTRPAQLVLEKAFLTLFTVVINLFTTSGSREGESTFSTPDCPRDLYIAYS